MKQDELLNSFFKNRRSYTKLYSYHHIVNGFAVELTAEEVSIVCLDYTLFHSFSAPSFFFFFFTHFLLVLEKVFTAIIKQRTCYWAIVLSFVVFWGKQTHFHFVCVYDGVWGRSFCGFVMEKPQGRAPWEGSWCSANREELQSSKGNSPHTILSWISQRHMGSGRRISWSRWGHCDRLSGHWNRPYTSELFCPGTKTIRTSEIIYWQMWSCSWISSRFLQRENHWSPTFCCSCIKRWCLQCLPLFCLSLGWRWPWKVGQLLLPPQMLFLEDAGVPKNWKENFLSMFWSLESKLSFLLRNVHAYFKDQKALGAPAMWFWRIHNICSCFLVVKALFLLKHEVCSREECGS